MYDNMSNFQWNYALVGNCQIGENLCETVRFGNLEVEETWWIFNNSSCQGEAGERKDKLISFHFLFGKDIEDCEGGVPLKVWVDNEDDTMIIISQLCLCDILIQRSGS